MDTSVALPPLPEGFTVSQGNGLPPLPDGFAVQQPSAAPSFGSNRGVAPPQNGDAMDMMKSFGGGAAKGSIYMLPNMMNQLAAGPQYLGRGIADTIEGNPTDKNFQPWVPYPMESLPQEIQPHVPQTAAGTGMDFLGQLIGGALGQGAAQSKPVQEFVGNEASGGVMPSLNNEPNYGGFLSNNQSGEFPHPPAPGANATPTEKLNSALEGAQQQTRFSGKSNPLETGQMANEAISHQYGIDKELQQQHYTDLNQIGSKFSMPAEDVYKKLGDLTGYLKDKVSVDSPEYRAYTELGEIGSNLEGKYGIKGTPEKTAQLPSWKQPMVTQKGESGQEAYGMQPSDAVDIKTTLNQLAKSGRFTNAGQAKILEFKTYIQNFLDDASKLSPEFGAQLDKAETQAARVGMYRDPKLASLWKPKPDYMSYKGETDTPAETFDRQANFMRTLNTGSPAAGEAYSLAQILPHEQVQDIFRNALLQNKQSPKGILQNIKTLGGATRWAGASPDSPLLTLADQLRGVK